MTSHLHPRISTSIHNTMVWKVNTFNYGFYYIYISLYISRMFPAGGIEADCGFPAYGFGLGKSGKEAALVESFNVFPPFSV